MAKPAFADWMCEQVGPKWAVVNVRTANRRAWAAADDRRLLTRHEYGALVARYEAAFGARF